MEGLLADDDSVFSEKNGVRRYFKPGESIQPCSHVETMMARSAPYGAMNSVQILWLKSKIPLKADDVLKSIQLVSRQVPHLQLCLEWRGNELWFKRMEKHEIDFDTSKKEIMEVYNELSNLSYDLWAGPLWRVRLVIPDSSDQSKHATSFSSGLIFAAQHCINDGASNMLICRSILASLNQITAGKVVVVPKKIPMVFVTEETDKHTPSIVSRTIKVLTNIYTTMLKNYSYQTSFGGSLNIPVEKNPQTKVMFDEFSISETENIHKRCKNANVTMNTFIVTIANFSLLTVAQKRSSKTIGSTTLNVVHCVDLRRYFDNRFQNATGCLISYLEDKNEMSLLDAKDFWDVARKFNSNIKVQVEEEKAPLKLFPLLRMAWLIVPINKFLTNLGFTNKTDCHYVASNMGNLKSLLPGPVDGDNVEIVNFIRSGTLQYGGSPFSIVFHTFRDKLLMSMDYCTNKMADDVAQDIFKTIFQYIRDIINFNSLQMT